MDSVRVESIVTASWELVGVEFPGADQCRATCWELGACLSMYYIRCYTLFPHVNE